MCTEGPLLILAGAGSGKTATMTRRIAYLIYEKGVQPYNILAVTFTNKAAKEMRERVESLIGETRNLWILTFHSACLRILRANAEALGYTSDFTVYDPSDQKAVIKNAVKALNANEKKFTPQYMMSIISDNKEKGISGADYNKHNGSVFPQNVIGDIYRGYEATLKKNNAMDFDDLICNTVKLFEANPDILARYQQRFKYIMVDEYQDTNYMQYKVVRLLSEAHRNICVVGDDDQCIYQWRGADIRNIIEFEKDFKGAKVIKLEQNYRSFGNILEAAHSVIVHNTGRKDKKLWTSKDAGEKITYYHAESDHEEAAYVCREIQQLMSSGTFDFPVGGTGHSGPGAGDGAGTVSAGAPAAAGGGERRYSDFAVLYRTNAQSRRFEEALMSAAIPYRVMGGMKYYDRKEIKDMLSYMRLVVNPADDISLMRVINEPKRGVGDKTLEKLLAMAAFKGCGLLQVLADRDVRAGLSAKAGAELGRLVDVIAEFHGNLSDMKVSDIYDGLLVRTGYTRALEAAGTIEAEGRLENLLEFKTVIGEYETETPGITLSEFLEKVALVADVDNHDASENAVALMTLHSAKGLEFPVVFMVGMEDGLFPGWRGMESADGMEEERRLCYVGMTRAKEKLYMVNAEKRTMYGRTDYTRESSFIRELDKSLLDDSSSAIGIGSIYGGRAGGRDSYGGAGGGRYGGAGSGSGSYGGRTGSDAYTRSNNPYAEIKRIRQNESSKESAKASLAKYGVMPTAGSRTGSSPAGGGRMGAAPGGIAAKSSAGNAGNAGNAGGNAGGAVDLSQFAAGDPITHENYGDGMIVSVKGKVATIIFDKVGTKKMDLSFGLVKKRQD